jgi:hypothetical protein
VGSIGVHVQVGSLAEIWWEKSGRASLARTFLSTREGGAKARKDSCVSIP